MGLSDATVLGEYGLKVAVARTDRLEFYLLKFKIYSIVTTTRLSYIATNNIDPRVRNKLILLFSILII